MPATISREDLERVVEADGAQLVEVLSRKEYEWAHLLGARNIPLRELGERAPRELDPGRPVVVYCNNFQ